MTTEEISKLTSEASIIRVKIIGAFYERLGELTKIAEDKGITEFGWTDGYVADPDDDDSEYETDE